MIKTFESFLSENENLDFERLDEEENLDNEDYDDEY